MILVFHHLQKDKQSKQRQWLCKLGQKRRESSKRNYYIISPRVIIKAIIIIYILSHGGVLFNHHNRECVCVCKNVCVCVCVCMPVLICSIIIMTLSMLELKSPLRGIYLFLQEKVGIKLEAFGMYLNCPIDKEDGTSWVFIQVW